MTEYEVWLTRDDGTRLAPLNVNGGFRYTWALNNVGYWELELPETVDKSLLAIDRRVQFWRKPAGGAMALDFQGLLRKKETLTDETGQMTRFISGPDFLWLLEGRACAYMADGNTSGRNSYADNVAKAVVRENLGSTVEQANRALDADYFSVAGDVSAAPSISATYQGRNVLAVCRDIADMSRKQGTALFFDLVPAGANVVQFRTYINQRGQDRTGDNALIFSVRRGNLRGPKLIEDWNDEANFVWISGQGMGYLKTYLSFESTNRVRASLWARREIFVSSPNNSSGAQLRDAALAGLAQGRPAALFSGELVSTEDAASRLATVYGRDWGKGDIVRVDYDDRQFDFMPRAVTISVDRNGRESITAVGEAYLELSAEAWRELNPVTGATV